MSADDFLSRWSRRKLEVEREEKAEPPQQPRIEDAAPEKAEPALTPEEIAALPKIEDIKAETDITLFLRKGVPELLKNAALRRMWSLDPAIRDYVGEAREYAYDWNIPGGVPGNGPLLPTDNVGDMLARVFGDRRPEREIIDDSLTPSAPSLSGNGEAEVAACPAGIPDGAGGSDGAPQQGIAAHSVDATAAHPVAEGMIDGAPTGGTATDADPSQPLTAAALPRRRHGGAMPV
jgi:hypothetical protein